MDLADLVSIFKLEERNSPFSYVERVTPSGATQRIAA